MSRIANKVGKDHFERMLKRGDVIIKEIMGQENLEAIKDRGAMITCNHIGVFDNYAVYKACLPILQKRDLYKVIREGNYTSFPGLYGYLFRHCNTLPLSSNISCMKELMSAMHILLGRGEKILIYPEQAMWNDYKKPRPLKVGAFRFAAKDQAPVLPIFITFENTYIQNRGGNDVLQYTIHILPPIYPDKDKGVRENSLEMCLKNYEMWKKVYEEFYMERLEYSTEGEVNPCSI